MPEANPLKGKVGDLQGILQNLIDDYVDQYPETPIQTIHLALTRLANLYQPGEDNSDCEEGSSS